VVSIYSILPNILGAPKYLMAVVHEIILRARMSEDLKRELDCCRTVSMSNQLNRHQAIDAIQEECVRRVLSNVPKFKKLDEESLRVASLNATGMGLIVSYGVDQLIGAHRDQAELRQDNDHAVDIGMFIQSTVLHESFVPTDRETFNGIDSGVIHEDMLTIDKELPKRVVKVAKQYIETGITEWGHSFDLIQLTIDPKKKSTRKRKRSIKNRKPIVKVRASLSEEYEISDDEEEDKELTWVADDDDEEFAQISDVEIDEEIFKESNSFQSQRSSSGRQIKRKVFDSDSLFYE
jgi:hypothetical protein